MEKMNGGDGFINMWPARFGGRPEAVLSPFHSGPSMSQGTNPATVRFSPIYHYEKKDRIVQS